MTASTVLRPSTTSSPSRDFASASTLRAGSISASTITGARPGSVTMTSGCRPAWPATARTFSDRTVALPIIPWSSIPRALLMLGSVWRGMRESIALLFAPSNQAPSAAPAAPVATLNLP